MISFRSRDLISQAFLHRLETKVIKEGNVIFLRNNSCKVWSCINGEHSSEQIAKMMNIQHGEVLLILRALEKKGLVELKQI